MRTIDKPQRWDEPFSRDMTDTEIEFVLKHSPFKEMDASRFPDHFPLSEIVRNDTRLLEFSDGELIVREGDYGNSAFVVISGHVDVILPPGIPESMLGRSKQKSKGLLPALSQLWRNAKYPEVRDHSDTRISSSLKKDGRTKIFLADLTAEIPSSRSVRLGEGNMIGEMAALARTQRSATVLSSGQTKMLEIRWQGLRDIRQRATEFREMVDRLYRERSLANHLRSIPLFQHLNEESIQIITQATIFETYGKFEWYASYNKAAANADYDRLIEQEPHILREGDYIDGLLLIRAGFARVSYGANQGTKTLSYLAKGSVFGLREIVTNDNQSSPSSHLSLSALGYTDVLRVPTDIVEDVVLPNLNPNVLKQYWQSYPSDIIDADVADNDSGKPVDPTFLDHLVERRFINGSATMLIDLDRCTRCDECVRACANGHNNNPRFIRHGPIHDNVMVANACLQCQDPVCMIGCPTGAIHRTLDGVIKINDTSCIGCSTCANACPYQNIRMVPIRDSEGTILRDSATHSPITKATKCDLCEDQLGGPACQRACPHDALVRMDMSDFDALTHWINRE
tara:strand:+ start:5627 stop:7333 length:1707 start_codon:yes stop_codon:yes gene_type:complete